MSIGERIIELRAQQNISQVQLAKMLDVSRQAVSKWENDQTAPDTIKLIPLADVLDTDVEYLATGRILPPLVVTTTETVEKIIEKPVIKTVERVVEKPIVKLIDKPVVQIKKVYRKKYVRNAWELCLVGFISFIVGFLIGLIF